MLSYTVRHKNLLSHFRCNNTQIQWLKRRTVMPEGPQCTQKYALQLNSVPNTQNNLDYSTWALKKENLKKLGLKELRLHCISLFTQYLALISQTYPFHILPRSIEWDIPFTHTHYLTLLNQTYPFCSVPSSDR